MQEAAAKNLSNKEEEEIHWKASALVSLDPVNDCLYGLSHLLNCLQEEESIIKSKDLLRGVIVAPKRWINLSTQLAILCGELLRVLTPVVADKPSKEDEESKGENADGDGHQDALAVVCRTRELLAALIDSLVICRTPHTVLTVSNFIIPRLAALEELAKKCWHDATDVCQKLNNALAVTAGDFASGEKSGEPLDFAHLERITQKRSKENSRLINICKHWSTGTGGTHEPSEEGTQWQASEVTEEPSKLPPECKMKVGLWESNRVTLQELGAANVETIKKFCALPSHPCVLDTFGYIESSSGQLIAVRSSVLRSFVRPNHTTIANAAALAARLLRGFYFVSTSFGEFVPAWKKGALDSLNLIVGMDGEIQLDLLPVYCNQQDPSTDDTITLSYLIEKLMALVGLQGDEMIPRAALSALEKLSRSADFQKADRAIAWVIVALEKRAISLPFQEELQTGLPEEEPKGLGGDVGEPVVRMPLEIVGNRKIIFGKHLKAEWLTFGGESTPGTLHDLHGGHAMLTMTEIPEGVKITSFDGVQIADLRLASASSLSDVKQWPGGVVPKHLCYLKVNSDYLPGIDPIIICGDLKQYSAVVGYLSDDLKEVAPEGSKRLAVLTRYSLWLRAGSKTFHHLLVAGISAALMRYVHILGSKFNPLKIII